jgi:hypothetical protein
MRLSEITGDARKIKRQIDALYQQYTVSKTVSLANEIVNTINSVYPTGYAGIDETLMSYKTSIFQELMALIMSSK